MESAATKLECLFLKSFFINQIFAGKVAVLHFGKLLPLL